MATTVEDQIDQTISSNDGMVAGDERITSRWVAPGC